MLFAIVLLAAQTEPIRLVTVASDLISGEVIQVIVPPAEAETVSVVIDGRLAPPLATKTPGTLNVVIPDELTEGKVEIRVVRTNGEQVEQLFSRTFNCSTYPDETVATTERKINWRGGSVSLGRSMSVTLPSDSNRDPIEIIVEKSESERQRRLLAFDQQRTLREVSRTVYRVGIVGKPRGNAVVRMAFPDDLVAASHSSGKAVAAYESVGVQDFKLLETTFDAATNELVLSLTGTRIQVVFALK
jgi:hypothetical protein